MNLATGVAWSEDFHADGHATYGNRSINPGRVFIRSL